MAVLHQSKKGCILLLLALVPAVFTSTCDLSNIDHVIQRNNTLLKAMNETIINMTQTANAALASVSTFPLITYLTSKGASQGNLLRFVALGGLNLDWTNIAKNYTVKDPNIGELGAHILSVFVIPAHAALKSFSATYSFSYGLFRATPNNFGFSALLNNATTNLEMSNLDSSCVAGRRYEVQGFGSDIPWSADYSNTSSSAYALLVYSLDSLFDKLLRDPSSAVVNDFIACNLLNVWQFPLTTIASFKLELYLADGSDRSADIKEVLAPSTSSAFSTELNGRTITVKTSSYTTSISSSIPPTTTTTTSTTTTSTTTTTTTMPTTVTTPSTLPSSTSIPTTPDSTSTTSTATPTTSQPSSFQPTYQATSMPSMASVPALVTSSALATVTNPTSLASNTASGSLLLTVLSTSSSALATGLSNTTQTASSISGTAINSSGATFPTAGGSPASTAVSANSTSIGSITSTPSSLAQNTGSSAASNTSVNSTQTMTTTSMQSSGFATPNVQSSTISAQSSNPSTLIALPLNATMSPVSNPTANSSVNASVLNSSTKHNYQSTTFDPDPLFLADVPVFTKLYNDDYLLRMKMGTMKPILEKASFYSVTIPAAIGLAALVVVCLVLLQIDCLPGKK